MARRDRVVLEVHGDGVPQNRSPELMTPAASPAAGACSARRKAGCWVFGFCARSEEKVMNNVWFQSALWMALALVAATASLYITISAALFEIVVGAIAGNTIGLPLTDWINYVAGIGAVVLTFLAGTD